MTADVLDADQQAGALEQCAAVHRSCGAMNGIVMPHGFEYLQQRGLGYTRRLYFGKRARIHLHHQIAEDRAETTARADDPRRGTSSAAPAAGPRGHRSRTGVPVDRERLD